MISGTVEHSNQLSRSGSTGIWGPVPIPEWSAGRGGYWERDEFTNFPQHITAQNVQKYRSYIDTGVTILQRADTLSSTRSEIGVVRITNPTTDNSEGSFCPGGNVGGFLSIGSTKALRTFLAFECCFKKSSVANNALAFFAGLAAPGLAAADTLIDDTGELASNKFIGFRVKHDAGNELDFVWKTSSGLVELATNIKTLEADTWYKAGFIVDPEKPDSKQITYYVNGREGLYWGTHTQIAAATFPSDTALVPLVATKVGEAVAHTFDLDWWEYAQQINGTIAL